MTRMLAASAASALLLICASCTHHAAASSGPPNMQGLASTAHYNLELDLSGRQVMYSMAQVKKLKPTSGEIMVGGKMVMMKHVPAGKSLYHMELHVRSKATGKPVEGAKVKISITSPSLKKPIAVPIAVMYGIKEGVSDWHYGNNIALAPGNYKVRVDANSERAIFDLAIPK